MKKIIPHTSTAFDAMLVFEMLLDLNVCLTIVTKKLLPKFDDFDCGFLQGVRVGYDQLADIFRSTKAACDDDVAHSCTSCCFGLFLHHGEKA